MDVPNRNQVSNLEYGDRVEPSVHEYRNSGGLVFYIYIAAAIFGAISFYIDGVEKLFTMLIAFAFFIYGIYVAIDSRVKLRIDDEGIYSARGSGRKIRWSDVQTYAVIERTQGASIKHLLRLRTDDMKEHDFELSRLDASVEDILKVLDKHLQPFN